MTGVQGVSNSVIILELPEVEDDAFDYVEDRFPQTRWYLRFVRFLYVVGELCLK